MYPSETGIISERKVCNLPKMVEDLAGEPGFAVEREWRGRRVQAWVPAPLRDRPLRLSVPTVRAAERACAALRLADARLPDIWEPLARVLLRNEGMASSGIEGLTEPIESVLIAGRTGAGGTAGWVADNLVVIDRVLDTADQPLTVDTLHAWHRLLMRHGRLPEHMVGAFRPSLGWVGGNTPLEAIYVPPPPSKVSGLVDDLIAFGDDLHSNLDPVSQAAVAHAQFEAIHPYGDGNGRLGRVLIARILRRRRIACRSTVPFSMAIARDPGGYLTGLRLFEQGRIDPWIGWFAEIAMRAAADTERIVDRATALMDRWADHTADLRRDHSALLLLPHLPSHPIIHAGDVARLLGISERGALNALGALEARGVLSPIDVPTAARGRKRRWFAARGILHLQDD